MTNAQFQHVVLDRFASLDAFQKAVLGRFDDLEGKVDLLASEVLDVRVSVDACVTRDEFASFRQETLGRFDGLAKNQERFDHELVAIIGRQDRLEGVRS